MTNASVTLTGLVPSLQANSISETMEFYTDVLGFEVTGKYPEGGEPTWCSVEHGKARIMFWEGHEHDADDHQHDDHDHPHTPTMTGALYMYPDDVDAFWERLKDRVDVAWPLQDMDYGMREFAVQDCNGYIVSFGKRTSPLPGASSG